MGRPSEYTTEIADRICDELVAGVSLRTICKADDMPAASTVFKWLRDIDGFSEQYARAKEAQADALFDEILDIADDGTNDWMLSRGDDENEAWRVNGEHIQRSRLRLDARKWMASKLQPKKYGDKVVNEHTGAGGGAIETVTRVERVIVRPNAVDTDG